MSTGWVLWLTLCVNMLYYDYRLKKKGSENIELENGVDYEKKLREIYEERDKVSGIEVDAESAKNLIPELINIAEVAHTIVEAIDEKKEAIKPGYTISFLAMIFLKGALKKLKEKQKEATTKLK